MHALLRVLDRIVVSPQSEPVHMRVYRRTWNCHLAALLLSLLTAERKRVAKLMSGRTFIVLPCATLTVPVLTPRGFDTWRARVQ